MGEIICLYGKTLPDIENFLKEATPSRTFADVVLCCFGGERFLTHRLVLSAASPYLQKILQADGNPSNNREPITIVLEEIESTELSAILDFIYTGSTKVSRTRLNAFLRTAMILHISLPPLPAAILYDTFDRDNKSYTFDFKATINHIPYEMSQNSTGVIERHKESRFRTKDSSLETQLFTSFKYPDMLRSSNKTDYSWINKDPTIYPEERWRKTWKRQLRHVANRVTASPWRQIVRPHHSPKVRSSMTDLNTNRLTDDKHEENNIGRILYAVEQYDFIKQDSFFENNVDSIEKTYVSKENATSGKVAENLEYPRIDPSRNVNEEEEEEEGKETKREKSFRCNDCGKEFSQLRNYKYHRSIHEGTREFAASCTECGKFFNDRSYLSSHMKIHRNRKEYACLVCGKSFNQRMAYNMHAKIHTGLKPHSCEQCGKAFSRKMLLKQHLRTHSGERPYQCHICQKAFADRSNMTLHTKLHSGLKPYQCTLCSKAFTKKHHLKTHLNSHTGSKPYSCSKCGLHFSQSSNMRTHFKKCTYQINPIVLANDSKGRGNS
ncbi:zinc finger protein 677-like [Polistes fuscatus]|uniref:zinc finger protein 677-like n=1 Tax=Polistes fuscatus TaxID=30207 RepID=UPI001CA7DEDB|nr:zinc finger protein 677-like [Polistes fuscatus]